MKFSELFESTEDVLIKRAKHVYSALKKGVLTVECNGPKKISYSLPDNVEFKTIKLKDGKLYPCIELPEEDGEIQWLENGKKTNCTDYTNELFLILNLRFIKFKVVLLDYNVWIEHPGHDYIEDISQVMGIKYNEEDEEELDESIGVPPQPTEKQLKKVKSVYTALKKGSFDFMGSKINYKLSENYYVEISKYMNNIIVDPDDVAYTIVTDDNREIKIEKPETILTKKLGQRVSERFKQFGIILSLNL